MKKVFTLFLAVLLTATLWAQSPEKISYQAVIRDASDNLITDTQIGMQISILQGSASGTAVYVETQEPTTNANGLVSLEIGTGTVESGDFTTIDWANNSYFIKTETDPAGGTSYSITGTSQLLSVPYALHAKTADSLSSTITETDPSVPSGTQNGEMQYWDGSQWVTVAAGNEGQVLTFTGGVPTWTTQLEDGEVQNPTTGEIWMDHNLGASQVADSSTDANAYGDLYQWGRAADGHEKRNSATTSTLSNSDTPGHGDFITNSSDPYDWRSPQNDNLWQGVNGTNNPCPSGYRLPTEAEWEAERASWSSNDATGAFASPLKLPVAGARSFIDGSLGNVGSWGFYWSSTVGGTSARRLHFVSSDAGMERSFRASGLSVRCLKD
jgi:uncharacterized protein (TIGR02145 family)